VILILCTPRCDLETSEYSEYVIVEIQKRIIVKVSHQATDISLSELIMEQHVVLPIHDLTENMTPYPLLRLSTMRNAQLPITQALLCLQSRSGISLNDQVPTFPQHLFSHTPQSLMQSAMVDD
jgi:hypothetical protein